MSDAGKAYDDLIGGTITQDEIDTALSQYLSAENPPKGPFVAYAKDCIVVDKDGKEYIDCQSQGWTLNIGHCVEEVAEAVSQQLRRVSHLRPNHDSFPKIRLIQKVLSLAPGNLKKFGLSVSGSTANEAAMKLALINRPDAQNFITHYNAWHGSTMATVSASYPPSYNPAAGAYGFGARFGPLVNHAFLRVPNPYCYRCYFGETRGKCKLTCARVLELTITKAASGPVAAVMLEPVQGSGGQVPCTTEYLREVRRICDKYNVLLIYDEVQTAFGRTGKMFAAEYFGVVPDIMTFAKGLGNGWPIGGILIDPDRVKGFNAPGMDVYTNMNNAAIQVASVAALDYLIRNNLTENADRMGKYITAGLLELQKRYPHVGDVRGPGLHIGVEFVKDPVTKEEADDEARSIYIEGLKRGVIFGMSGAVKNVIKIKPPLTITKELADRVVSIFSDCLKAVYGY